jgi:hypothetical protein
MPRSSRKVALVLVLSLFGCGSVGGGGHDAAGAGGSGTDAGGSGKGGSGAGGSGTGTGGSGTGTGGSTGSGGASGATGTGGQQAGDAATGGSSGGDAAADASGDGGGATCPATPTGVVSWWHADGDYTDAVGGITGASAGGVTFGPGAINQGFVLDGGASSYVQMPDTAALRITGPLTLDAWVNPTAAGATERIIDKIATGGGNGYLLDLLAGPARFIVGSDQITSGVSVSAGVFTHVAGVYNGTSMSVYLNGVLAGTKTTTVAAIPSNNLPFRVGADSTGATRFTGTIDEPRVFNRALSPQEIQTIYQQGSPAHCGCVAPPSGLVSWWPGDGNVNDVAGGNNGMDPGGVTFAPGAVGQGISLTGATNSYVQVADAANLRLTTAITMEAWVNPVTPSGRIVDKITAGGTNGYLLDMIGAGLLRIDIGGAVATVTAANAIAAGKFTHVAGVYDGTNLSLYVNGARVVNMAAGVTAIPTNMLPLRLGADSTGASLFHGIIDEARIYSRALTPAELLAIYQAGAAARCAP